MGEVSYVTRSVSFSHGPAGFIRFTNQNIFNVLIAMDFAHGGHTNCVAGEAVQYLTLQTKGLQPTAERRGR